MTAMTAMAAPSSSPRRPGGLRGPRPQPLKVSSSSSRPSTTKKSAAPLIVYEHTPKVVHARPQEFMTVVQQLTGKPTAPAPALAVDEVGGAAGGAGGDPLLLTLGQRRQVQAAPAAGLLMSPGFVFSPNTMQYIQELSPLL